MGIIPSRLGTSSHPTKLRPEKLQHDIQWTLITKKNTTESTKQIHTLNSPENARSETAVEPPNECPTAATRLKSKCP